MKNMEERGKKGNLVVFVYNRLCMVLKGKMEDKFLIDKILYTAMQKKVALSYQEIIRYKSHVHSQQNWLLSLTFAPTRASPTKILQLCTIDYFTI